MSVGIPQLNGDEQALFEDIARAMQRHPNVSRRFNVALDHQHFAVADGEVLHETNDPEVRVMVTRVLKRNDLPPGAFVTQWQLTEAGPVAVQYCCK